MEKKTLLWLDDLRNPFLNIEGKVPTEEGTIIWVLNYDEFTQYIEKFGLPDIISFDHDLGEEHYTPEEYWDDYEASKAYQEAQVYTEKTGFDCAKWLVDYCMDNNKELPKYYVHSANPVGADNIRGLLENYLKFNGCKTSHQWYQLIPSEYKLVIMDPDGWDRTNYQYSFYEELITEVEFKFRLMKSTIRCNHNYFNNNLNK